MGDEVRWSMKWRAPGGYIARGKAFSRGGVYCILAVFAQSNARTAAELNYRLFCNLPVIIEQRGEDQVPSAAGSPHPPSCWTRAIIERRVCGNRQ